MDKEYAGITGVPSFNKAAAALAYGDDSPAIKENRVSYLYVYMKQVFYFVPNWHSISLLLLNLSLVLVRFVWALSS